MIAHSQQLLAQLLKRRTVRDFSSEKIPTEVLHNCIHIAGRAPSGANQQPWHFSIIQSNEVKKQIREAAEEEERAFYSERAPKDWLAALSHLGTNADKPYLETAPALIAIFQKSKVYTESDELTKTYYPKESVGLATGFLISALHLCGLASLTHTPSPMNFLNNILDRPSHEKPFLLLVVGYPAEACEVPLITKQELEEFSSQH